MPFLFVGARSAVMIAVETTQPVVVKIGSVRIQGFAVPVATFTATILFKRFYNLCLSGRDLDYEFSRAGCEGNHGCVVYCSGCSEFADSFFRFNVVLHVVVAVGVSGGFSMGLSPLLVGCSK